MKRVLLEVLLVICVTMAIGLLMGLALDLTLDRPKAHELPGVSFGAGMGTGIILAKKQLRPVVSTAIIGATCGVIGWVLYRFLFPL